MNNRVKNLKEIVLSNNWYTLKKISFDYLSKKGIWNTQNREAYDRGNGAVILLYNLETKNIILTKQFRMPTYLNGNDTGMMIEACAGLLDTDDPETAIIRETEEETGFKIKDIKKVYEVYMSPGSVTEILYFFIAEYSNQTEKSVGGGIDDEEVEVLELPFNQALEMVKTNEIKDAKTILLLQYLRLENLL